MWSEKYPDYEERMKAMAVECAWHQTPIGQMDLDEQFQLAPME